MAEEKLLRQAIWRCRQIEVTDQISVSNLRVTANAGVDVWGRKKPQPALLTVTVSLPQPFSSAAEGDVVDSSTVHYGKLSKSVILSIEEAAPSWLSSMDLAHLIEGATSATASPASLMACEVDVFYPKGSMLGEGAGLTYSRAYGDGTISRVLYLKNVRVPCLIGVNSHERLMKQPIVADLWIDCLAKDQSDEYTRVEQLLTKAIEESSFETLESLATKVVSQLMDDFVRPFSPGANIRLRVTKPMAVPFADAPSIEIFRAFKP
ncbi:hypothetical protein AOQ84DRAFT_305424 [Glonium stellatum]|uniref:dihydroneopterin aldolase n=1 Tax=Glonium stellatum TaxID=574774 RepID=A0A8E2EP67_9PEZI|nr:hypothetical protein AOQ84DRAFT_305424 [Glonium stellatum]